MLTKQTLVMYGLVWAGLGLCSACGSSDGSNAASGGASSALGGAGGALAKGGAGGSGGALPSSGDCDEPAITCADLNGTLRSNGALRANSVCTLTSQLEVEAGVTLCLERGVTIRSKDGWIRVAGNLEVRGSEAAPVVFTSVADPEHGGSGSPSASDWIGISFEPGSSGSIAHATLRYVEEAIHTDRASPPLSHIRIEKCGIAINAAVDDELTLDDVRASDCTSNGLWRRPGTIDKRASWAETALPQIITQSVRIGSSGSLTIGAGVVAKFQFGSAFSVAGELRVEGEQASGRQVVFTSLSDDSRGGPSYLRGGVAPVLGEWPGIQFEPGSTGSLRHAEVHFAETGVYVDGASPSLSDVKVSHSGHALSVAADDHLEIATFSASDCSINGLLRRPSTLHGSVAWNETGVVQVIPETIEIATDASLSIGSGAVLKFMPLSSLQVKGQLRINPDTAAIEPAILTSILDDTLGGPTNGVGGDQPYLGDWVGVVFESSSSGGARNAQILYAASGIRANSAAPSIVSSLFKYNSAGVWAAGVNARPVVTQSSFLHNGTGAGAENGGQVVAESNWWGAADGPGGSANGSGQSVTSDVDYTPFLTAPP
ncbi:MAG: hypothetical protein ACOY0T_38050 [Myxococcota bacterium]